MDNGFKYSYKQIFCDLESGILSGKLLPGYRIPSVRALAVQYQVNPNTVQHEVKKLERAGLLISLKGSGIMVTENTDIIYRLKQERIGEIVYSFVTQMKLQGFHGKRWRIFYAEGWNQWFLYGAGRQRARRVWRDSCVYYGIL